MAPIPLGILLRMRHCRIYPVMHGVVLTPTFERQAKAAGFSEDELLEIVSTIAADPLGGDLMAGTGGARKVRHAGRGHGKSGGYRTIHYFGGDDIPLFMLALIDKGQRANLSKADQNKLSVILPQIAEAYRRRSK